MSYRKTRKQRNQNGGAGFFSKFSKSAPVAPSPSQEEEVQYETILSSLNRVYLFLYSKLKPSTPGYIPLKEGQLLLTQEQKNFFQSLLQPYINSVNSDGVISYRHENIIRDVLGAESDRELEAEIRKVESPSKLIRDVITNKPAIAETYAGDWYRFISLVSYSEKQLEYIQDYGHAMCRYDYKFDQNRPIRSLSEQRCVLVIHNKEQLNNTRENTHHVREYKLVYGNSAKIGPGFPYLLVNEEYMPVANKKPVPYARITSSKLMKISFVLDAFINNGVKEIQPDLADVIQREQKQLWNQYSLVKVVDYRKLSQYNALTEKFIAVSDTFETKEGAYFLLPTLTSFEKVKGMDAMSTLQMRVRYPEIWATLGQDPNLEFFLRLPFKEQIRFSILQSQQYLKVAQTNPDTAFKTVHLTDLRKATAKELFLQNIDAHLVSSYREILKRHV